MSQYDVEVEARLQALEEKVNSSGGSSDEKLKALEARFDDLLARLQDTPGVKSRVGDI